MGRILHAPDRRGFGNHWPALALAGCGVAAASVAVAWVTGVSPGAALSIVSGVLATVVLLLHAWIGLGPRSRGTSGGQDESPR
jgi:hypothetical protein